jgi:hypothetical protein
MAVTVLGKSALVHGMKQIGINEYFPPLPKVDLLLYRASGPSTPAAMALHEYLAHYLSGQNGVPVPGAKASADPKAKEAKPAVAIVLHNALGGNESRPAA